MVGSCVSCSLTSLSHYWDDENEGDDSKLLMHCHATILGIDPRCQFCDLLQHQHEKNIRRTQHPRSPCRSQKTRTARDETAHIAAMNMKQNSGTCERQHGEEQKQAAKHLSLLRESSFLPHYKPHG